MVETLSYAPIRSGDYCQVHLSVVWSISCALICGGITVLCIYLCWDHCHMGLLMCTYLSLWQESLSCTPMWGGENCHVHLSVVGSLWCWDHLCALSVVGSLSCALSVLGSLWCWAHLCTLSVLGSLSCAPICGRITVMLGSCMCTICGRITVMCTYLWGGGVAVVCTYLSWGSQHIYVSYTVSK